MSHMLMLSIVLAVGAAIPPAEASSPSNLKNDCVLSFEEVALCKSQEVSAFDQAPDGWRKLARAGCNRAAADLIDRYVVDNRPALRQQEALRFHQAQNLALAGENALAAKVLLQVLDLKKARNGDPGGPIYVEATHAFLVSDRKAFDQALMKLRLHANSGTELASYSKVNLTVVEGLGRCFGRPYSQAIASPCVEVSN